MQGNEDEPTKTEDIIVSMANCRLNCKLSCTCTVQEGWLTMLS